MMEIRKLLARHSVRAYKMTFAVLDRRLIQRLNLKNLPVYNNV